MATRLPSAPPILPGLSYIRPLGSGGFADVFLYEQDMPRRDVAVKVLPSDVRDPELRRMFNAEADVLAHLSAHPSIVTVYQAGISAEGRPYIVMEFCPGSLAQRYRIERIPVTEVLAIGVKMAGALESAHRAGLAQVLKCTDRRLQLHPVVRRLAISAGELTLAAVEREDGGPTARPRVAGTGAVGVDDNGLQGSVHRATLSATSDCRHDLPEIAAARLRRDGRPRSVPPSISGAAAESDRRS